MLQTVKQEEASRRDENAKDDEKPFAFLTPLHVVQSLTMLVEL